MRAVSFHHTKKEHLQVAVASLLLAALLVSSWLRLFPVPRANASDWFNPGYQQRKLITIDGAQIITGPHAYFPVLVSFTDPALRTTPSGKVTNVNGYDIIFTDTSHTPAKLPHEIEAYDPATGAIKMWVRISSLAAATNQLYLYYGNSSITTSQQDITGTWSENGANNYKGVWHLKETSGSHADSTSNGNNSTLINVLTQGSAVGKIDGSDEFNGTSNYVDMGDTASLNITGTQVTASAWVKGTPLVNNTYIVSKSNADGTVGYSIYTGATNKIRFFIGNGVLQGVLSTTFVWDTNWRYIVGTYDGTSVRLYVDGVQDPASPLAATGAITSSATFPLNIGRYNGTGLAFPGTIDEVRISSFARSAGWIQTEYNNQNNPGCQGGVGCATPQAGAFVLALGGEELGNSPPSVPGPLEPIPAFANKYINDTTPDLGTFSSTDAESNDVEYEIQWDTDPNFALTPDPITRISTTDIGFVNTENGADTSPFTQGQAIRFTLQPADALLNNTTYWWRVRARDPAGGNSWGGYSASRSITINPSPETESWLQTTSDQFTTILTDPDNVLTDTEASPPGGVKVKGW